MGPHKISTLCPIDIFNFVATARENTVTTPLKKNPRSQFFDPTQSSSTQRYSRARAILWGEFYFLFASFFIHQELTNMTVVRYEPWALVNRFQKDIDRLFSAPQTTAADSGAWLPPVDIHEEANQFVLNVDLPGVEPKDVEITSEQGVLTIRGQREDVRKQARDGHRRIERIHGEFQRRFSLPETADVQNIKAKAVNGVLEISIPKLAQVQPHRIAVEAA